MKKNSVKLLNLGFVITCTAILVFLLRAPEETTAKLPHDEDHSRFFSMQSKKDAEKLCGECHSIGNAAPLPQNHPPKYRCLFCHKRT